MWSSAARKASGARKVSPAPLAQGTHAGNDRICSKYGTAYGHSEVVWGAVRRQRVHCQTVSWVIRNASLSRTWDACMLTWLQSGRIEQTRMRKLLVSFCTGGAWQENCTVGQERKGRSLGFLSTLKRACWAGVSHLAVILSLPILSCCLAQSSSPGSTLCCFLFASLSL